MGRKIKKWGILLFLEAVLLAALLPGCFRREQILYEIRGSEISEQAVRAQDTSAFRRTDLALTPGVYRVRINVPENSSDITIKVESTDAKYKALRCNPVTLYAGQTGTEFELYVFDRLSQVSLICEFPGGNDGQVESLSLSRLNLGSRILVFCLAVLFLAGDGLVWVRGRILSGRMSWEQQLVFWGLLGAVLLSGYPYLTDYFDLAADGYFHLLRIEGLFQTLRQGRWFPVWVQSYWLYDHGYAVSTFYGELFLLLPVFFRAVGFSIMTSYKMFLFVINGAAAWIAYLSFYRCARRRLPALLGSVLYVISPYWVYNLYNRMALGETLAMMFFPLLCCGLYLLYTGDIGGKEYGKYKVYLIVGLSGIVQSHVISTEMAAAAVLTVCVLFWRRTFRRQTFVQLLQAALITLALNAWFWIPLLYMMGQDKYLFNDLVNYSIQGKGTELAGALQLWPNMGAAQTRMFHCEPIQLGIAFWAALAFYGLLRRAGRDNPYTGICDRLAGAVLAVWFLSTRYFPWDALAKVPGVRYLVTTIQFPTRMMAPATALCAFFTVFLVCWLGEASKGETKRARGFVKGLLLFLTVLGVGSAVYHVNDIAYSRPVVHLYTAKNMGTEGVSNGEYLLQGTLFLDYYYHGPRGEEGLLWIDYEKNGTEIRMTVENETAQTRYLELPLIGYRGYQLEAGESAGESPYLTEQRGEHGDLRIAVPAGYAGALRVWYGGFPVYRLAELISALTISGLAGCFVFGKRKARIRKERLT